MSILTAGKTRFNTGFGLSAIIAGGMMVAIGSPAEAAGQYTKRSDALELCAAEVRAEVGNGRVTYDKARRTEGNHRFWFTKYKNGSFKQEAGIYCMVHPSDGVIELTIEHKG